MSDGTTIRTPISASERHLLSLVIKGADLDGWAPVSAPVWPLVDKLPTELVEREMTESGRGRARLTAAGYTVLRFT